MATLPAGLQDHVRGFLRLHLRGFLDLVSLFDGDAHKSGVRLDFLPDGAGLRPGLGGHALGAEIGLRLRVEPPDKVAGFQFVLEGDQALGSQGEEAVLNPLRVHGVAGLRIGLHPGDEADFLHIRTGCVHLTDVDSEETLGIGGIGPGKEGFLHGVHLHGDGGLGEAVSHGLRRQDSGDGQEQAGGKSFQVHCFLQRLCVQR